MIIQHNMQAMNANRMLGGIVTSQSKVTEKLSSGYRINRAGDDAAGLSISEKMRSQIRGLDRASTNAQDAISLIQTAEGALTETHSILQRMRELAVQAATDTNVEEDREAVQSEIEQLTSEINRIAKTTEFNSMKLLNGEKSSAVATGDAVTEEYLKTGVTYDLQSAAGVTNAGNLKLGEDGKGKITFADDADFKWSDVDLANDASVEITKTADGITVAIKGTEETTGTNSIDITDKLTADENGDFAYEEHGVSFTITKENYEAWADSSTLKMEINGTSGIGAAATGAFDATGSYGVESDYTSGKTPVDLAISGLEVTDDVLADTWGDVTIKLTADATTVATTKFELELTDGEGNVIDKINFTQDTSSTGSVYEYDSHGLKFNIDVATAMTAGDDEDIEATLDLTKLIGTEEKTTAAATTDGSLYFQVGANANQIINVSLEDMSAAALGITSSTGGVDGFSDEETVASDGVSNTYDEYALDLTQRSTANDAITKLDEAIKKVSEQRSALGAVQNRLEHTIANLDTSAENLQAAESRIRDVDMASEMVTYSKNNILQQAAQSMLAQANQSTQGVLSLLQ